MITDLELERALSLDFPAKWVPEKLVLDLLPWENAKYCSYQEFFDTYTLHDSEWLALFANVAADNSVVVAVIWDAHFIPDDIFATPRYVPEWPYLFIKLSEVEEIKTAGLAAIGRRREISDTTFLETEEGNLLEIKAAGGNVEILFRGEMAFLALDRDGKRLNI